MTCGCGFGSVYGQRPVHWTGRLRKSVSPPAWVISLFYDGEFNREIWLPDGDRQPIEAYFRSELDRLNSGQVKSTAYFGLEATLMTYNQEGFSGRYAGKLDLREDGLHIVLYSGGYEQEDILLPHHTTIGEGKALLEHIVKQRNQTIPRSQRYTRY